MLFIGTRSHRDVNKGGGRRGCARPLGAFGPKAREGQIPADASETLTEVAKHVWKATKKARHGIWGPSDHLDPPEKQGPWRQPVIISDPSDYQGPSDHQGPLWLSGSLPTVLGPSDYQGAPLTNRGPPNCQLPSNGKFQAWGPLKLRHYIFDFFVNFGPLPKNSGRNPPEFWVGIALGPWKPPPLPLSKS